MNEAVDSSKVCDCCQEKPKAKIAGYISVAWLLRFAWTCFPCLFFNNVCCWWCTAGWTPLHEACNHGYHNIAKYLLESGANVNSKGFENDYPLHDAVSSNHHDVSKIPYIAVSCSHSWYFHGVWSPLCVLTVHDVWSQSCVLTVHDVWSPWCVLTIHDVWSMWWVLTVRDIWSPWWVLRHLTVMCACPIFYDNRIVFWKIRDHDIGSLRHMTTSVGDYRGLRMSTLRI